MNRLKFWLFALLVIGLAAFALRLLTVAQKEQGLDAVDRQLRAAQARAEQAERAATAELAELAGLAAQDAKLAAALRAGAGEAPKSPPKKGVAPPPPPPSAEQLDAAVDQAAADAVAAALAVAGRDRLERVVLAVSREGLERKPPADADAASFLREAAIDRKVRRGYAVLGGKLHSGASVPVGERGALAVFVPVDAAWAADKAGDTGAAVVLAVGKLKPVVWGKVDAEGLLRKASGAYTPISLGTLGPVDVGPSWLPVKIPLVPSLLLDPPGDRMVSRPLAGAKDGKDAVAGKMILALSTRSALEPAVRLEWWGLAGLVLLLLLAVPFGILVKPTEVAAALPPILLDAARRIEKGDFSVRAPVLAGKLGTLSAALNKAVDAAQSGAQTPVASVTSEFFARGPAPAEPADPFALPVRPPRTAALSEPEPGPGPDPDTGDDTARLDGSNLTGAAFEAAPVAAPRPAPMSAPAPARPPPPAPAPAPAPTPAAHGVSSVAVTSTMPAGEGGEEEQHWREVFRDFVRTRAECGESAEGLTYERFRQKLESNKSALVTKYGCKTVRFQVYVKDGKAALKATPVR